MLRRFLVLCVGALALAVVLGAPGEVHAQRGLFRGGFLPGFRPTPMFRFDPRFRGGMFDPRFDRGFDRGFDRFEDRFENRFDRRFFDPRFSPRFGPGFFRPF
jgi:hypothetical protein